MELFEKDGHLHTPFCPHRHADDSLEAYLAAAEEYGLKEITFCEHSPMPDAALKYTPYEVPTIEQTLQYFDAVRDFRAHYRGPVRINVGLEVEYLEGYEDEMTHIMSVLGPHLDEGIITTHLVKIGDRLYDITTSKEYWDEIIAAAGGAGKLYRIYYETLIRSIDADIGPFKPTRVAHPSLVLAQKMFFDGFENQSEWLALFAKKVKDSGYSIDLNTQGIRQKGCQELYGVALLPYIIQYNIPICLGSDAHKAADVAFAFDSSIIRNNLSVLQRE